MIERRKKKKGEGSIADGYFSAWFEPSPSLCPVALSLEQSPSILVSGYYNTVVRAHETVDERMPCGTRRADTHQPSVSAICGYSSLPNIERKQGKTTDAD